MCPKNVFSFIDIYTFFGFFHCPVFTDEKHDRLMLTCLLFAGTARIMATIRSVALMIVTIATVQLEGTYGLLCYECQGTSGEDTTIRSCGLPFKDNALIPLRNVSCTGKCVTQVAYRQGMQFIYNAYSLFSCII